VVVTHSIHSSKGLIMKLLHTWLSRVVIAASMGLAASASAGFAPEGWYTGEDVPRALQAAEERGLPIALIYMDYDST